MAKPTLTELAADARAHAHGSYNHQHAMGHLRGAYRAAHPASTDPNLDTLWAWVNAALAHRGPVQYETTLFNPTTDAGKFSADVYAVFGSGRSGFTKVRTHCGRGGLDARSAMLEATDEIAMHRADIGVCGHCGRGAVVVGECCMECGTQRKE